MTLPDDSTWWLYLVALPGGSTWWLYLVALPDGCYQMGSYQMGSYQMGSYQMGSYQMGSYQMTLLHSLINLVGTLIPRVNRGNRSELNDSRDLSYNRSLQLNPDLRFD